MKKLIIAFIGTITFGSSLPALAGPDWQLVEQGRKAKQASELAHRHDAEIRMTDGKDCPPQAPVLQLDHGGRAQTTPYVNRIRMEKYRAAVKTCVKANG